MFKQYELDEGIGDEERRELLAGREPKLFHLGTYGPDEFAWVRGGGVLLGWADGGFNEYLTYDHEYGIWQALDVTNCMVCVWSGVDGVKEYIKYAGGGDFYDKKSGSWMNFDNWWKIYGELVLQSCRL